MGRIVPCLWFDAQAEDAARFYVSIFEDSRIERVTRYGPPWISENTPRAQVRALRTPRVPE